MVDALWSQASGVSYTAAEDRKLIDSIYNEGVIDGLVLSIGSGLNVNVSPGYAAMLDEDTTGKYLASLDTSTAVTVTANATSNIYLEVDPDTALCTLSAGSVPTNPHLALGSAVAGPSTITSVSTTSARPIATFRSVWGDLTVPTFHARDIYSSTMTTTSAFFSTLEINTVDAAHGVRMGNMTNFQKRAKARLRTVAGQVIPIGAFTKIDYTTVDQNDSDYPVDIYQVASPGKWFAPVAGQYVLSAGVVWTGAMTGAEIMSLYFSVYNSDGGLTRTYVIDGTNENSVWSGRVQGTYTFNLYAGQYAVVRVYLGNGASTRTVTVDNYASMALIQAD